MTIMHVDKAKLETKLRFCVYRADTDEFGGNPNSDFPLEWFDDITNQKVAMYVSVRTALVTPCKCEDISHDQLFLIPVTIPIFPLPESHSINLYELWEREPDFANSISVPEWSEEEYTTVVNSQRLIMPLALFLDDYCAVMGYD